MENKEIQDWLDDGYDRMKDDEMYKKEEYEEKYNSWGDEW